MKHVLLGMSVGLSVGFWIFWVFFGELDLWKLGAASLLFGLQAAVCHYLREEKVAPPKPDDN